MTSEINLWFPTITAIGAGVLVGATIAFWAIQSLVLGRASQRLLWKFAVHGLGAFALAGLLIALLPTLGSRSVDSVTGVLAYFLGFAFAVAVPPFSVNWFRNRAVGVGDENS